MNSSDLAAFCEHTLEDVYAYALKLTGGDPTRTADLVQDTYAALVAQARRTPDHPVELPWLMVCCRHRHLDNIKKQRRRERNQQRGWRPRHDRPVDDSTGVLESLAQLQSVERTAIVLRHVDQLPIAEIADALGKSVAATDSLLRRGRDRLRTHYLASQEGVDRP